MAAADPDTMLVKLGNTAPPEGDDNAVTYFRVPTSDAPDVVLTTIRSVYGQYHSEDPPEWVESDDELLAGLIARAYTWPKDDDRDAHECRVGRPRGWKGRVDPDLEDDPDAAIKANAALDKKAAS